MRLPILQVWAIVEVGPGAVLGAGSVNASADPDGNTPISVDLAFESTGDGSLAPYTITVIIDQTFPITPQDWGTALNPVTTIDPGFVVAHVEQNGINEASALVNFSVSNAFGVLSQTTALTDANGDAVVQLDPGAETGAGTITVASVLGGTNYSDDINFASSATTPTTDTIFFRC